MKNNLSNNSNHIINNTNHYEYISRNRDNEVILNKEKNDVLDNFVENVYKYHQIKYCKNKDNNNENNNSKKLDSDKLYSNNKFNNNKNFLSIKRKLL